MKFLYEKRLSEESLYIGGAVVFFVVCGGRSCLNSLFEYRDDIHELVQVKNSKS